LRRHLSRALALVEIAEGAVAVPNEAPCGDVDQTEAPVQSVMGTAIRGQGIRRQGHKLRPQPKGPIVVHSRDNANPRGISHVAAAAQKMKSKRHA
jgi:hypothetical protein